MRVKLTLNGSSGELDSKTIDVPDDYQESNPGVISDAIREWMDDDCHILDVGDSITIMEVL
jgi:hypothetical protein